MCSQNNWVIRHPQVLYVLLSQHSTNYTQAKTLYSFIYIYTVCFKQTKILFSFSLTSLPFSTVYDPHSVLMNVPLLHLCLVGPSAFYCLCLVFTKNLLDWRHHHLCGLSQGSLGLCNYALLFEPVFCFKAQ